MASCCNTHRWFMGIGILSLFAVVGTGYLAFGGSSAIGQEPTGSSNKTTNKIAEHSNGNSAVTEQETQETQGTRELATFGGGCFWCVEAIFEELEGVDSVTSGYMGGHVENPTYEQVCDKTTGHAEVCQVSYDPTKVDFQKLLQVFFSTHDPTTLNRQGNDDGPQYRSVVFFHSDEQKKVAQDIIKKLDDSGAFNNPIVTEVTEASTYYLAENYHQNFFLLNPSQGYCRANIAPKLAKFRKVFADDLKSR